MRAWRGERARPGTALQFIAARPGFRGTPFPNVAAHVVDAVRADAALVAVAGGGLAHAVLADVALRGSRLVAPLAREVEALRRVLDQRPGRPRGSRGAPGGGVVGPTRVRVHAAVRGVADRVRDRDAGREGRGDDPRARHADLAGAGAPRPGAARQAGLRGRVQGRDGRNVRRQGTGLRDRSSWTW